MDLVLDNEMLRLMLNCCATLNVLNKAEEKKLILRVSLALALGFELSKKTISAKNEVGWYKKLNAKYSKWHCF